MEIPHTGNTFQSETLVHDTQEEDSRYVKRRNEWNKVAGNKIETLSLGSVDRTSILKHMLAKVRQDMGERYGSLLGNFDVENWLEESLSSVVKEICEQGKFDLTRYAKILRLELSC